MIVASARTLADCEQRRDREVRMPPRRCLARRPEQADSPTDEDLQALLQRIITRLMKLLTRRSVLVEEEEDGSSDLADAEADSDEARALRPLQAAACTYRIAFGPRAGQKVFTLQGAMPLDVESDQELCADHQGNSRPSGQQRHTCQCLQQPAADAIAANPRDCHPNWSALMKLNIGN